MPIAGDPNSGAIILKGTSAHLSKEGDLLTIMSFASATEAEAADWRPKVIVLGKNNAIINIP